MNPGTLQDKFLDATEEAKAILDLLVSAKDEPLRNGTRYRAAIAAQRRIEKAEKFYHKLERAYLEATKEGEQ